MPFRHGLSKICRGSYTSYLASQSLKEFFPILARIERQALRKFGFLMRYQNICLPRQVPKSPATVNAYEWSVYAQLPETGRCHATVCHTRGQRAWARDDDRDGVREVHNNTMEGIWTGLRNFVRPFRGVSKWFLDQHVAIFEWAHNLKQVTGEFLRAMMIPCTLQPT